MSELSDNDDKALALGKAVEKIGGLHYIEAGTHRLLLRGEFGVSFLTDFGPSVAALAKILTPFKDWTITLVEGNEVSPLFGLVHVGDGKPDIHPLIYAICKYVDGDKIERSAFVQPAPDLVM